MCKDCGGGSIYVHGNVKSYCKVCRKLGSAISGMATTMMTTMMVQMGIFRAVVWNALRNDDHDYDYDENIVVIAIRKKVKQWKNEG